MRCIYRLCLNLCVVLFSLTVVLLSPAAAEPTQQEPEMAQRSFRNGVIAFQSGDYGSALNYFSTAIQLDASSSASYGNRCLTYIELQQYEQAIADCNQALSLKPTYAEAYLNRGVAQYRSGNYEKAIADFSKLLQLTPHDPRAYYNRGLAQMEQGAYREAIVDYGAALRQTSPLDRETTAVIQIDRGIAHFLLEQHQAAIADFTRAIQFNPQDVRALFNRGCAYHHQGNLTAALQDFSQVTTIAPQYGEAYFNRGLIYQQLGEQIEALTDLRQAAQHFQEQGLHLAYRHTLNLIGKILSPALVVG